MSDTIDYREAYYGEHKLEFIERAREDSEWAALFWNDRLAIIEAHLEPHRRRILDIGSGPGWFLKSALDRGWSVVGVDPSRQACEHARELIGQSVIETEFEKVAGRVGTFDAVHLNNVLEHVENPTEILALTRRVLTDGGLICVGVPNDGSPFQLAASRTCGEWWVSPHHLNYWTFASMSEWLTRLGFTEIARTTSFPMEIFPLMGMDYTRDSDVGRDCHKRRKRFDMTIDDKTRRAFYSALASVGIGREAVIISKLTYA